MTDPLHKAVPPDAETPTGLKPANQPELPLLRFSLRHIFWLTLVLSTLLAVIAASDGLTATALLLAAMVVVLHVGSTALGRRLRIHADEQRAWEELHGAEAIDSSHRSSGLAQSAPSPPSLMHGREVALRYVTAWIAGGALVGGCFGGMLISLTIGHRTTLVGLVVGSASMAVLGAWFTFLGVSFWAILRQSWREAVDREQKDRRSEL